MTALPKLPLIEPRWAVPAVGAAMSTRAGGVSSGPFASLDLGAAAGDDPACVAENRRRFAAALGARPVWLRQVHGAGVLQIGAGTPDWPEAPADAAWTCERGVACVVGVADCLPVLLASADGQVVGAAHAGWRGLAAGVIESTVAAIGRGTGVAPGALLAWLGPCIGERSFEVGADVLQAFGIDPARPGPAAHFRLAPRPDGSLRWRCDLRGLAIDRLRALGLGSIEAVRRCTFESPSTFFSFRRDGVTGRMAAAVWRR